MTDDITWENPPAIHKFSAWDPIAEPLKSHPGKWARLVNDMPKNVVHGGAMVLRRRGFQVAERTTEHGNSLYARWPE